MTQEISLTKSFFHWVWTSHKVKNISKKTTRNHQGTISTKESDTMILIYESTLKQLKNKKNKKIKNEKIKK